MEPTNWSRKVRAEKLEPKSWSQKVGAKRLEPKSWSQKVGAEKLEPNSWSRKFGTERLEPKGLEVHASKTLKITISRNGVDGSHRVAHNITCIIFWCVKTQGIANQNEAATTTTLLALQHSGSKLEDTSTALT